MAKSSRIPRRSPPSDEEPLTASADFGQIGIALSDWAFWLKVLLIVGPVFWIYAPVYHGTWLMDDELYLGGNPVTDDPHRLWKAWLQPGNFIEYYPIEQSVQWAQRQFWPGDTLGYHLTNVVLHAFSALLVWRVLTKFNLRSAWLGGLLFAVHPAMVESVSWMVELKNTLSLPPFLIAICAYIEYDRHRRRQDYLLALGAFLVAMLCKISMAPFPAVILLYDWWRRGRITGREVLATLPFWVVSLVLAGITLWCGEYFSANQMMKVALPTAGIISRIALIGATLTYYLGICIVPFGQMPLYPRWSIENPSLLQFLPWPILIAALYVCWAKRESWGRHVLLGFGFFCLTLAPFLGFITVSYMRFTWVMDHFIYIPILGLIGLAVAALDMKARNVMSLSFPFLQVAAVLLAGLLAWSSQRYAEKYTDQKTLYEYAITKNADAWAAYNNLAAYALTHNETEKGLELADKALALNPDYPEAHFNRGLALDHLDRLPEAIEAYKRALQLTPDYAKYRLPLARALAGVGRLPEAIDQYRIFLSQMPEMLRARSDLASLLIQTRRLPEAADVLSQIVQKLPKSAQSHNDLGTVLYMMHRFSEAIDEYREAVRLEPRLAEGHNNLGGALQHNGHLDEAIKEFTVAVSLDPQSPNLHVNLARALAQGGQKAEAIQQYKVALQVDPQSSEAITELAALRSSDAGKTPGK